MFSEDSYQIAARIAQKLREAGFSCEIRHSSCLTESSGAANSKAVPLTGARLTSSD